MSDRQVKTKCKIRKGDQVLVIAGNCRGQTGAVIRKMDERIVVQGVNMRKRHMKPTQSNPKGSIVEIERPVHISNVQICDADAKPIKLKVKLKKSGERVLVYKKDGKEEEYRSLKKQEKK